MPIPTQNETEEQFMGRCIPFVLDDESAEDHPQAVAMCASMYADRDKAAAGAMEHKTFAFELTNLDAEGRTVEGYASAFGNVDAGGDIVHPGAFTKTLKERGDRVKFLWQHNQDEPLGPVLQMREDSRGLFVKAKVSATTRGNDALELLRDRALDGLSIGYDAVKGGTDYSDSNGAGRVRNLREVKLYEFSLVTFPMNESAGVTAIKSDRRPANLKATWTTAYVNTLPDASFLYIAPGGEKDDEGKTEPRNLRYFPYRDADGAVDLPHLRNAIARIPDSKAPGLDDAAKAKLQDRARRLLEEENEKSTEPQEEKIGRAISAARAGRIADAMRTLAEVLEAAGIDVVGFGEPDDDDPDQDKHNALPPAAASKIEAEPPPDDGPDPLTLKLRQVEIGIETNKLLEVTQ